ncbi:MAG: cytochrome B [Pseudomonadales bacterium]|nr:cytochrome B [Pseudomonadales bacterium]
MLVKVWDPVVRVFHWSTVGLFVGAYFSAEWGQNESHLVVGYGLAGMLLVRLLWGVLGSHHARFANFWYGPRHSLNYARSLLTGKPDHYLGHNPMGAAMVFVLLTLLLVMSLTGLLLAAGLEFEGPLLLLNPMLSDDAIYLVLGVHRFTVYLLLGCVALHVLGVISSSRLHQENLVLAMITGKKPLPLSSTSPTHEGSEL